mmetsp:Transcript_16502/g.30873  ORF Transcript_16502/g.30873 Transcript_16502/m.30873 type:complete len:891 (-) Transcript_16502:148-2820(-)
MIADMMFILMMAVTGVVCVFSQKVLHDAPYGQTFVRQDLFSDLPFVSVQDALYDANGYCFVTLSSNTDIPLWSTKRRLMSSSVAGTEGIYSDWRPVKSVDDNIHLPVDVENPYLKIIKAPDSIILVSSSSVVEIVLDFNCTTLVSVRTLTDGSSSFGDVLSASYADVSTVQPMTSAVKSSVPVVWLGTSQGLYGLTPAESVSESAAPWRVLQVSEVSEPVTSLLWVQQWERLLAGTSIALYELTVNDAFTLSDGERLHSSSSLYHIQYEWIGGNLDFEVKDMTYDMSLDCVWLVQQEALHQRRADGTLWRQGHYQGLITNNLTAVAVTLQSFGTSSPDSAKSHFMWAGTKSKGLMRRQIRVTAEEDGSDDTAQEDPWQTWLLFYGARYLPDAKVVMMVSDDNNDMKKHGGRKQSTVLVVSELGVSFITTQEWSLQDKEAVMQSYQYPRHDRHGIVADVSLAVAGDTSHWSHSCEDSDSIWTSQYAVAASMRYAITQKPADRSSAWQTFEGLEKLAQLSGIPGLVGRTFCSPEEVAGVAENGGTSGCGVDGEGNWHDSSVMNGWVWKGDTSSDTINGHYYAYGVILDMVAETVDEQDRVYKCIDDITSYIVDNDFYYIDVTGEPTKWGRWNPADLNDNADYYSERGLNSLEILAFLSLGYSVTGKEEFLVQFQSLSEKHGYYTNALNQKIDNPFEDNHSDNELSQMAYHTLFYSLYRLQRAVDIGKVPYGIKDTEELKSRRDELLRMTSPVVPSIKRWWSIVKHERSPLWLSVVAGAAGVQVPHRDRERAVASLQLYPADMISWNVHNSGRWDCPEQPYYGRDNPDNVLMRHIRPPQERIMGHYNIDPYTLDSSHEATDAYSTGVGGNVEFSPAEWLLPYWSLRFYGVIEE